MQVCAAVLFCVYTIAPTTGCGGFVRRLNFFTSFAEHVKFLRSVDMRVGTLHLKLIVVFKIKSKSPIYYSFLEAYACTLAYYISYGLRSCLESSFIWCLCIFLVLGTHTCSLAY